MKPFWEKLLGKKKSRQNKGRTEIVTAPLANRQSQDNLPGLPVTHPQQLLACCGQSVGIQRDHNEDSIFTLTTTLAGEGSDQLLGLYIIADGMGGHQYGEVASNVAIRSLASHLLRKFHPYLLNPSENLDESMQEIMRAAITETQRAVMQAAPGSGTTLTAALVIGQQLTMAHVGDSRAYLVRNDGRTELLTRDHSLVKRLEELGQLTADEAASHPQRNVLYRALGQGEILEPDVFSTPFPQPGTLVICSDGLWGMVQDAEISRLINSSASLQSACNSLVEAANSAGGPDNISVILVQLSS